MDGTGKYSVTDVALAARELRQAAGSEEELFSAEQVVSMLGDEIRLLRERGFSEGQIVTLLDGFDIKVSVGELGRAVGEEKL